MTAPTADDPPVSAGDSAPAATSGATDPPPKGSAATTTPSSDTTPGTPPSTLSGGIGGSMASATGTPNSGLSLKGSTASQMPWLVPGGPMEVAAQANEVATMILSGTIDLDTARAYASVVRTVAQAMNTEVNRARIEGNVPDLRLRNPHGPNQNEGEPSV